MISLNRKITFSDPSNIQEILDGCLENNASCQKMLYKTYYSYAKGICLRYASSREEAEEVLNDGFMKVFTKLRHFERGSTFRPWLKTIMINTALDYYRKNQKYASDISIDDAPDQGFNNQIIDQLAAEEILEIVQRLSPAYRTVFSLYVVEGYSHKDIAEMLHINEGTSKSNLAKARMKLQEMIMKQRPELKNKLKEDYG